MVATCQGGGPWRAAGRPPHSMETIRTGKGNRARGPVIVRAAASIHVTGPPEHIRNNTHPADPVSNRRAADLRRGYRQSVTPSRPRCYERNVTYWCCNVG